MKQKIKMMTILLILFLWTHQIWAADIRLSVGETQYFYFPGLKKFENHNKKLVQLRSIAEKDEIALTALSKGNGKILIEDQLGSRTLPIIVYSKLALDLEREIKELTADIEGVSVRNAGHKVLIKGKVMTPQDMKTLERIEKLYDNVLNLTEPLPSAKALTLEQMITIDVKMLELNKNKLQSLGLELPPALKTHFALDNSTLQTTTEFDLIFHALEKNGFAKILANPKLVCKNGGRADFLAGGEIPLRLSHGRELSVQWKPYGISLDIQPLADHFHQIATTLKIEISTLNSAQSVDGLPSLLTRRMQTAVNVPSGETIVLSGLIHQEQGQDIQKVPAISSLPILGELFKSKHFQNKETELMIFVTPSIYGKAQEAYDEN
ncbi:MAG: hypothetical protein HYW85_05440 [Deltaproteobacteria bacterium]|nr:hypothetical protein [Deltaproteobacteria bacterium]